MPNTVASCRRSKRTRARGRAGVGKRATGPKERQRRCIDRLCHRGSSICQAGARIGWPKPQRRYRRARWYDGAQGRWISQDPIGFEAGDANLYRYVGNGPTTTVDPSGLKPPLYTIEELYALEVSEQMSNGSSVSGLLVGPLGGIPLAAHGNGLPAGNGPVSTATRPLTAGELAILNRVFGEHLNTDGLCVGTRGLFPRVEENTMTPGYTPWFPEGLYTDDFSQYPPLLHHFIHEMTHVLQTQNGNFNWMDRPYQVVVNFFSGGTYLDAYPYSLDDLGKPFYHFNFEQQADIVADYHTGRIPEEYRAKCRHTLRGFRTQLPAAPPDYR